MALTPLTSRPLWSSGDNEHMIRGGACKPRKQPEQSPADSVNIYSTVGHLGGDHPRGLASRHQIWGIVTRAGANVNDI